MVWNESKIGKIIKEPGNHLISSNDLNFWCISDSEMLFIWYRIGYEKEDPWFKGSADLKNRIYLRIMVSANMKKADWLYTGTSNARHPFSDSDQNDLYLMWFLRERPLMTSPPFRLFLNPTLPPLSPLLLYMLT